MKRVFIFSSQFIFSQGIKLLLDEQPELEVVGWETEIETAISRVQEIEPDAILVVTKNAAECPVLEEQRLLRIGIKAKIVELSLADSGVGVYRGEQLTITEIADLVKAIN